MKGRTGATGMEANASLQLQLGHHGQGTVWHPSATVVEGLECSLRKRALGPLSGLPLHRAHELLSWLQGV